jgi:lipoate-protein ligase A
LVNKYFHPTGATMTAKWRLLQTQPTNGAYNMALDEACLLSTAERRSLPTLRLFSWEPPTLSLGYAQKSSEVDFERLHDRGWGLVRRPTGGRAILHTDELTYSVAAPLDDPVMAGSLLDSYQRISRALLAALNLLGVEARGDAVYNAAQSQSKKEPVCFEVPSNFEITVSRKKLIGSAQARKHNGVLQHGSLPLTGDLSRITQVLLYPSEEKQQEGINRLLLHAGTVESLTGKVISFETAAQAFIKAFSMELDLDLVASKPTSEELLQTKDLMEKKYQSDNWTLRL